MNRIIISASAVCVLYGCVTTGLGSDRVVDERSGTIPVDGVVKLRIDVRAGLLEVKGDRHSDQIRYEARFRVNARSDRPEQILELMELTHERSEDTLTILTRTCGQSCKYKGQIDLILHVPSSLSLDISDSSGPIQIHDIEQSVRIDDSSGSIAVERIGGDLEIDDTSGKIEVRYVGGSIDIKDSSGGIQVAERYEFDGIELDFARGFVFPPGEAWRGKPFLLAARVPETLMGCHFDGLDVETWAKEQLVDIFVLECRSLEVDVDAFRRITAGRNIKLYPVLDHHHASDGYCTPPIEVFRGLVSNWWRQGADGLQTFNFAYGPRGEDEPWWTMHQQFYREISSSDGFETLDKTFVVQRRGGGHGQIVHANPEDWSTPRHGFANTNLLSLFPAPLDNLGKTDLLLPLYVGEDLDGQAEKVKELELWVLLHDSDLGDYLNVPRYDQPPAGGAGRIERAAIRDWFIPERKEKANQPFLYNAPPRQGVEKQVKVRVNNILLASPEVRKGWLVFPVAPEQSALGENLVGVRVINRGKGDRPLLVEKLELRVRYEL